MKQGNTDVNKKNSRPVLEISGRFSFHGIIGFLVLIGSWFFMIKGIEPFSTWFYSFAWWSYILIVDSIVHRIKGNSLIVNRTKEFLLLIPFSVCIWLIFELVNLSLKNWYYINVPDLLWMRWVGYALAFSTVLPGIFETTELLESLKIYKNTSIKRVIITRKWHVLFFGTGLIFLMAPVFLPTYCFPLIWVSFFFLLEPVIHKSNGRSLIEDWERGTPQKLYLLLTAGLICGGLWEFWNHWANTKWIYTVPFFDELKIFEMPVLGFLGFPPFAVECYVMYNFVSLFRNHRGWEEDNYNKNLEKKTPLKLIILSALIAMIFSLAVFYAVDSETVDSYTPYIRDINLINQEQLLEFERLGFTNPDDLLIFGTNKEAKKLLSMMLNIPEATITSLIQAAGLIRLKGIGTRNYSLLKKAGVVTSPHLPRKTRITFIES